jgi:lysozyme
MRSLRLEWLPAWIVVAAAGGGAACGGNPTGDGPVGHSAEAVTVCAGASTVKGIDVSSYQDTVDWTTAKGTGLAFAIARISDGSALDSQFATNWSGMKNAGLVRGAYQFFEPGESPTAQATIVINAVGVLGAGDLPVTADMEVTGGQSAATIAANLQTWMAAVKAGTGKAPMIYTAEGFWDGSVASSSFAANPLWAANWGVSCPDTATGWSAWSFWQYSDSGTVSGVPDAVDLDEFNGSLAELQAFAGGASTTSDAGAPAPYYAATYVSQSWPLASMAWTLTPCQTVASTITLKNTGTTAWDDHTRLATTSPRNRTSDFADSTWVAADRAAEVSGTVAPGATYTFQFDFHAPPTAGTYTEYFGLVEDGVAWFSDPGQGGPSDMDIEANIQVAGAAGTCTVDPDVPDGGTAVDAGPGNPPQDAGTTGNPDGGSVTMIPDSGGVTVTPDGGVLAADAGGTMGNPPGAPTDAASPPRSADGGVAPAPLETGSTGCSIGTTGGDRRSGGAVWAFAVVALVLAKRRRPAQRAA